jgi:DNA-binding HxlR family transcriptional regulator
MKNQYNLQCNIAQTLNIIGDKWSLLILHQLLIGRETYKEIQDNLDKIPTNLLSGRLKDLEIDELIEKKLYQTHPPRYNYSLTKKGYDLEDVFNSLILWGEKHLNVCYKRLSHNKCNHSVTHQYYCSHCDMVVKLDDLCVLDPDKSNINL